MKTQPKLRDHKGTHRRTRLAGDQPRYRPRPQRNTRRGYVGQIVIAYLTIQVILLGFVAMVDML